MLVRVRSRLGLGEEATIQGERLEKSKPAALFEKRLPAWRAQKLLVRFVWVLGRMRPKTHAKRNKSFLVTPGGAPFFQKSNCLLYLLSTGT
jgi:hypothetical protein